MRAGKSSLVLSFHVCCEKPTRALFSRGYVRVRSSLQFSFSAVDRRTSTLLSADSESFLSALYPHMFARSRPRGLKKNNSTSCLAMNSSKIDALDGRRIAENYQARNGLFAIGFVIFVRSFFFARLRQNIGKFAENCFGG